MRVNSKKFFITLLLFIAVVIGMGIREYYDAKKTHIETIKSDLLEAASSASILPGSNYYDHLWEGQITPIETATMIENMTSFARSHKMGRLYSVFVDANNTLRYGMSNIYTASNQTLIGPLDAVHNDREQLTKILKSNQPYFHLDPVQGFHTLYLPSTTASGIHYLTVAVTEPTSLQKLSQMAIFDTIAKSLLLFAGILPFLIVYRNVLANDTKRLSEEIESTTEKLQETTEILHERVEEKTKELINEGFIDPLTHLPNRHRLAFDMDRHAYHALVIIHLKNFQELNHFFGASITDSLRQQVSLLLTKLGLIAYRLGRDEFALLLDSDKTTEDLPTFAEFLLHSLNQHSFNVLNEKIIVSIRLGIDTSVHLSLSHADEALANATETSQDFSIYKEDKELEKEQHQNIAIASSIREAYYDGRIICYYQPIISTQSGEIQAYETLARLISKDATLISPLNFLAIAKKTALYPEISREIIRQTCEAFANRSENFTVHLSILDIADNHTLRYIEETIVGTNTARRIIFELSEEDIYDHYVLVSLFIARVKQLGVKISVDNFGAGYSNLDKIIHLDIDYLKIDGGLINKINDNRKYLETVRIIAAFANAVGAKSIAENVENDVIFTTLQTLNIDYVQGFYIGGPSHLP
ncbi:MAG: GGDEF domain-containing protein [Pseudomonadota bacterium]